MRTLTAATGREDWNASAGLIGLLCRRGLGSWILVGLLLTAGDGFRRRARRVHDEAGNEAVGVDPGVDGLSADGIDVSGVKQSSSAGTGVAMILVEDIGQNRIVLASGANGTLSLADIDAQSSAIEGAAILVVQLEVPMPVVQHAIAIAHAAGVPVLLNPAPAAPLPESIWPQLHILVPNESEASLLAGISVNDATSAFAAARIFRQRGVNCVLVTLGEQGVAVVDDAGERHIPAQVVKAVDTTAAGDTFIGGLTAGLIEGMSLDEAVSLG